jgi:hypothetical protein
MDIVLLSIVFLQMLVLALFVQITYGSCYEK